MSKKFAKPDVQQVKHALDEIKGSVAQPFALPRKPRNDAEAQRLYFHIRTLCFWLDAASSIIQLPYLNKLPFTFGLEAIIGTLIPVVGDIFGFFLGLYIVLLCMQFGLPAQDLWKMFTNCLIDVLVGLIPIVGDLLDVAFKSNMRNLAILEDHLLHNVPPKATTGPSTHFAIRIPPSGPFWPNSTAPDTSAFYAEDGAPRARQSFFFNILGSPSNVGSQDTKGWRLGGASRAQIEDAGGWTGQSAHVLSQWAVALFARVAGKTQQAAGAAKKKKAY